METNKLVLITLTGERQQAFSLCEKYLDRQTNKNWSWLVIDDGREMLQFNGNLLAKTKIHVIYPEKKWSPGENTQSRNLLLALDYLETERKYSFDYIGFVEDDDWYHPQYIENLVSKIPNYRLIGEAGVHFYLIQQQKWRDMANPKHASLCQTVLHKELIPILREAIKSNKKYIDIEFWRLCVSRNVKRFLFPKSLYCVGLKELPGRGNIGSLENNKLFNDWQNDPDFKKLEELIGEEDCKSYRELKR